MYGKSHSALDKLRDCIWDMDMKQLFNIQFQCQSQAAGCKRVGCQVPKAKTFQPTTQRCAVGVGKDDQSTVKQTAVQSHRAHMEPPNHAQVLFGLTIPTYSTLYTTFLVLYLLKAQTKLWRLMGPNAAGMSPLQIVAIFRFSTNRHRTCNCAIVQHSAPIDVLDNNSLLNIICLCQPPLSDRDEGYGDCILLGLEWNREHWQYKLMHVCQRWQHLILGSTSYLGLCLLCIQGTLVADMLVHSPPFPIIIDHFHKECHVHDDHMMENDVEGIVLALAHHNHMHRICFQTPLLTPEEVIIPIDGEFLMLEYLCIAPMHNMNILLPKTFQAPQLCHPL